LNAPNVIARVSPNILAKFNNHLLTWNGNQSSGSDKCDIIARRTTDCLRTCAQLLLGVCREDKANAAADKLVQEKAADKAAEKLLQEEEEEKAACDAPSTEKRNGQNNKSYGLKVLLQHPWCPSDTGVQAGAAHGAQCERQERASVPMWGEAERYEEETEKEDEEEKEQEDAVLHSLGEFGRFWTSWSGCRRVRASLCQLE